MIVVCAWCGKVMGEKESSWATNGEVSHGICEDCFWQAIDEIDDEADKPEERGGLMEGDEWTRSCLPHGQGIL